MTYYTCERSWESMLSCIYTAWTDKRGHRNIRLLLEPVEQLTLFDEYIHVEVNPEHVQSVTDAINQKISPYVYRELLLASMAYEDHILDNIYRCLLLGFAKGPEVLGMVQYRDIMENERIRTRLRKEIHHFQEFIRFHLIDRHIYVAHFEPKSRIATALGAIFADRMPSEDWLIVDDVHREMVVHQKDSGFYLRTLTNEELERIKMTEQENDLFTDMWKLFFDTIAIKERRNENCQRNLFPLWLRKHAVEFGKDK